MSDNEGSNCRRPPPFHQMIRWDGQPKQILAIKISKMDNHTISLNHEIRWTAKLFQIMRRWAVRSNLSMGSKNLGCSGRIWTASSLLRPPICTAKSNLWPLIWTAKRCDRIGITLDYFTSIRNWFIRNSLSKNLEAKKLSYSLVLASKSTVSTK